MTLGAEGLTAFEKRISFLEKMSHEITDGDLRQGPAHRTGSARNRSSGPSRVGDLGSKFSVARARTASMGS